MDDDDLYDVVMVGGGAAGLGAGLVLAQAQCRVAVIDAGEPRNRFDSHMHGYLTRDGLPPTELVRLGRDEVTAAGGELVLDRVTSAEVVGDLAHPRFLVGTAGGRTLQTRRVVVATGLTDELPPVDGLERWWGGPVFHCPYCHGVEITSDMVVGVLACRPDSVLEAHLLLQWAEHVVLLTNGCLELTEEDRAGLAARGIGVVEGEVVAVEGDDERLSAVVLADGRRAPLDQLLVGPTTRVNREVLDLLGVEVRAECDDDGVFVATDRAGMTSVPGVYAVGNVRDNNVQVIEAAAQGLNAAISVNASLTQERVQEALGR